MFDRHDAGLLLATAILVCLFGFGLFQFILARAKHKRRLVSTRARQRKTHWAIRVNERVARARHSIASRLSLPRRRKRRRSSK